MKGLPTEPFLFPRYQEELRQLTLFDSLSLRCSNHL